MSKATKQPNWRIRKREEWQRLIEEAEGSGESVQDFCRRHDIAVHNFYQWRGQFRAEGKDRKDKSPLFVPVHVRTEVETMVPHEKIGSHFMVHGNGGVKMEFPSGCSSAELRLVMQVLSC